MKPLLAALLLAMSGLAYGETWFTGSILSYHVDRTRGEKNEVNPGIGFKHFGTERDFVAGGVYRNSNRIDSGYVVGGRCLYRTTSVCGGGILGVVTGYERNIIAMGGLVLTLHGKTYGVSVLAFPKDGGVFGVQIERRFW